MVPRNKAWPYRWLPMEAVHRSAPHENQSTNACLPESWPSDWHYEDTRPVYDGYLHESLDIRHQPALPGQSVLPVNMGHTNPSTILPHCHAYRTSQMHSVGSVLPSMKQLGNRGQWSDCVACSTTIRRQYKTKYMYLLYKHTPIRPR